MLRINKNDFEVFVGCILIHPVRIENSEIGAFATYSFLSGSP